MLAPKEQRVADWMLLLLELPGHSAEPVGILLCDGITDELHVRLRDISGIPEIDEDVLEVFSLLPEDLLAQASESGGMNVLRRLQDSASLTVQAGLIRQIGCENGKQALDLLYEQHIAAHERTHSRKVGSEANRFAVTPEDLKAAGKILPISRVVGLQALVALLDPDRSLKQLEQVVSADPVLAAHLLSVANLTLLSPGFPVRTIRHALAQIGLDLASLHIWGFVARELFIEPGLQSIWNHSIEVAQLASDLATTHKIADPAIMGVQGLLHDVGRVVWAGLESKSAPLRNEMGKQGQPAYPVFIERKLSGVSHAEVGADLLSSWSLPPDLVEAVRRHHSPSGTDDPRIWLLYFAEAQLDRGEDFYRLAEYEEALWRLKLEPAGKIEVQSTDNGLRLLRFAAGS